MATGEATAIEPAVPTQKAERPLDAGPADQSAGSGPQRPVALELRNVSKRYGSSEAVRGVDLEVYDGEMITLLGPSGSGKTTILKLVAGFTDISGGSILLRGKDISGLTPADRGIGMVFQNYALFPHLTVDENVGYGLKMRGVAKADRAARVSEVLEVVGLPEMEKRLPRELSGGQQQRVALARALAFGPSLLLMDEPLGALDRELRDRMMVELRRVHQQIGVTALYVTHDREEALVLSDRVAIMRDGRLEGVGTPAELLTGPSTRFIATFFGGHALIPATVKSRGDHVNTVVVDCLGQQVTVPSPADEPSVGEEVALVLPSSAVTAEERADALCMDLAVLERFDLGDRLRVTAQVVAPDGTSLPALLRLSLDRRSESTTFVPGRSLRVYADAAYLWVVR